MCVCVRVELLIRTAIHKFTIFIWIYAEVKSSHFTLLMSKTYENWWFYTYKPRNRWKTIFDRKLYGKFVVFYSGYEYHCCAIEFKFIYFLIEWHISNTETPGDRILSPKSIRLIFNEYFLKFISINKTYSNVWIRTTKIDSVNGKLCVNLDGYVEIE